jgi:hypothetical protein
MTSNGAQATGHQPFERRRQLGELSAVVNSDYGPAYLAPGYARWPFADLGASVGRHQLPYEVNMLTSVQAPQSAGMARRLGRPSGRTLTLSVLLTRRDPRLMNGFGPEEGLSSK